MLETTWKRSQNCSELSYISKELSTYMNHMFFVVLLELLLLIFPLSSYQSTEMEFLGSSCKKPVAVLQNERMLLRILLVKVRAVFTL